MKCPNSQCNKEIHDHSSYCKFCHQRVTPIVNRSSHAGVAVTILTPLICAIAATVLIVVYAPSIGRLNLGRFTPWNRVRPVAVPAEEIPPPAPAPVKAPDLAAQDLIVIKKPEFYFINSWDTDSYKNEFYISGNKYTEGIGMYLPSGKLKKDEIGTSEVIYSVGEGYKYLSFDIGADSKWGYSAANGTFCLSVFADGRPVYTTGWNDYKFTDSVRLGLDSCSRLRIILEEIKGRNWTLNIVLGNLRLSAE